MIVLRNIPKSNIMLDNRWQGRFMCTYIYEGRNVPRMTHNLFVSHYININLSGTMENFFYEWHVQQMLILRHGEQCNR